MKGATIGKEEKALIEVQSMWDGHRHVYKHIPEDVATIVSAVLTCTGPNTSLVARAKYFSSKMASSGTNTAVG